MDSPANLDLSRVDSQAPCVCVVDDDTRTAQVLAMLLRMDGHAAEWGSSARILDRLGRNPTPAALIMSVSMGRSDAVGRVLAVRRSHPSLSLLIVTEHPHLSQRLMPLEGPQPLVFTKPVDYPALQRALRALLAPSSGLKA
jgi:DNA-binding response OmpR family regulator